ncbi:MAG: penicillin-binding protein activator [Nitrosomonas sp.]|nr:penicillin-binding protein activator [Nitrosomonas sp.]
MQRFYFVILLVVVTLYGSPYTFATHPEGYYSEPAPVPAPAYPEGYYPESAPIPAPAYASVPHVGLLLPLDSPSFGAAAQMVKEGFVTAAKRESALPLTVRIYATTDDPLDILITYHRAVDAGAVLIVGPLTRNGVTAVATSHVVPVPTLALNSTDVPMLLPPNLYLFGMQMETEASHAAELALATHDMFKKHAIIIKDAGALSLRLQNAFADRWLAEYGNTAESVEYEEEQGFFSRLRKHTGGQQNVVFLALDANKSRRIRNYLDPETPVYATSQVFISESDSLFNHDLNGVYFMDMPWLLQPDHPAVMAYDNIEQKKDKDTTRLFALGIDAFRLMSHMLYARSPYEISFDGVTGRIQFESPALFIRKPLAAQFDKGGIRLLKSKETQGILENQYAE